MDRREAIKRAAFLMGGVISAPAIMGVLNGCTAKPTIDWKPVFLTEDQGILVARVVDIIIPKTSTPGAVDVGVPGFIDLMLNEVYSKEDKDKFIRGLNQFDKEAQNMFDDRFIELDSNEQLEFVTKIHQAAIEHADPKQPQPHEERLFILMVKELTLLGFFTSEVGATQVLRYEAVPGAYKGCVPLSEVGKTWAV